MARFTVEVNGFKEFAEKCRSAGNGDFKKAVTEWLEGLANEFLVEVQEEIIRRNVVDSRLLLQSFHKGHPENVWIIEDGGMTLEVGTNVKYAEYVNDGHWMNPQGVAMRFVPGIWKGDRFIHQPGANTGMMLKQQWVKGAHFWEGAIRIFERMFPGRLEEKLQEWLESYFG